ncbi:MAG: CaiB/BaiF CoA-transferase family protein [Pseudomonadota bacterium]
MPTSLNPPPLDGVRVLDLSRVLAGPWATQLLGDLGADIIKIEKPGVGDDTRHWGPPFAPAPADGGKADASYFRAANRNKRSLAIDIAKPEGVDIIRRLAAKSDVLVENFKVGGLKKYSLDYEALRAINPKLIYCSITGFGQTGPYRDRPGYDYMIQAMGGLMSITGQPDGAPGAEPMKVGVAVADLFAGMYASNAVLAALMSANRDGMGQHIDVSLFDCQLAMLANQASSVLGAGVTPTRLGNAHPSIAPYQVVRASDDYFVIAIGNDNQFKAFADAIDLSDLATDSRFETNTARVENREVLNTLIAPALLKKSVKQWLEIFATVGAPAGPINDAAKALNHEQAQARDMVVEQEACDGAIHRSVAHPVKYSQTPARYRRAAPRLGADTDAVLKSDLGLSDADVKALRDRGVI